MTCLDPSQTSGRRACLVATLAACLPGATLWAAPRRAAGQVTPSAEGADAPARTEAPLAHGVPAPANLDPRGYLCSEKYDGVRAWWDGSTLRFRSGLPIAAPRTFRERLPRVALDGELWMGRGTFEALSGAVRRSQPDESAWRELRYMVFDLPAAAGSFRERAQRLRELTAQAGWSALQAAPQQALDGPAALERRLREVVEAGGEGLMLHRADAWWAPGRSEAILKVKPQHDAEAVVLAHVPGRGRLTGRMGALKVRADDGREFELGTGFTDAARAAPPAVGSRVTYTHQGYTDAGLPRFASFLRVHQP